MPQHSTLNDSLEEQGSLTHVLLFHGANPRWLSDRIIFVKSNLEILPEYREAKVKRAAARPGDSSAGTEEQGAQETRTVTEEEDDSEPTDEGIRQRQRRHSITVDDEPAIDITPSNPKSIAIFEQSPRSQRTSGFSFTGYHKISHIALLAPRSKELTRMLEQKWAREDRYGNASFAQRRKEDWEKSL